MNIIWLKCVGEQWCNLLNLNLSHPHFDNLEGIYIIWHGTPNPAVVYVGQGNIRDRLSEHRQNPEILFYRNNTLFVTWAAVPAGYRDGIEKYLADTWRPKVGSRHPNVQHIVVNSPWK